MHPPKANNPQIIRIPYIPSYPFMSLYNSEHINAIIEHGLQNGLKLRRRFELDDEDEVLDVPENHHECHSLQNEAAKGQIAIDISEPQNRSHRSPIRQN